MKKLHFLTPKQFHITLLALFVCAFLLSGIHPNRTGEWLLEAIPTALVISIFVFTYRRFTFTSVTYVVVWIFALLLLAGAHFSYGNMPIFNEIRDYLGYHRNDFDRLVHLFQGITPFVIARELIIRKKVVPHKGWQKFLVYCVVMMVTAVNELVEWTFTIFTGIDAIEAQGDRYDTQTDMLMAFYGWLVALIALSRLQDKQIAALDQSLPRLHGEF